MILKRLKDNNLKIRSQKVDLLLSENQVKIDDFLISNPGEYEIKGVFVYAVRHKKSLIFVIEMEGMKLGYLSQNYPLTDEELGKIGAIDVLLIPCLVQDLVNQIEPRLVIPIDKIDNINLKKKDLPREETKIWGSEAQ
jgi:hypothetical protein